MHKSAFIPAWLMVLRVLLARTMFIIAVRQWRALPDWRAVPGDA
jgi:hypothetical protein